MIKRKRTMIYLILLVCLILFYLADFSLARFIENIKNKETSETVNLSGGVMEINYEGGAAISAPNMTPSDKSFATKTFTVKGRNTIENLNNIIRYHLILQITSNNFTHNAIKIKLTSANTSNNGTVVPSINTLSGIGTGKIDLLLGSGSFSDTDGISKTHTYKLEMHFPVELYNFKNSNKSFNAKILVKEGLGTGANFPKDEPTLQELVLNQFGGKDKIAFIPPTLFETIVGETENSIYKAEDDYGISYIYRGSKSSVKNNLIFAGFQWKIVRINGDESIRILYNGICPNNECKINLSGSSTLIASSLGYNIDNNDNKYVGYMYGSKSVPTTTFNNAHSNDISSNIKKVLDAWYQENILGKEYEYYISDTLFCNDRELSTGLGYGNNTTYYIGYKRLRTDINPTLKCTNKRDRFTVNDKIIGNGDLTYPVALLSADEAAFSGLMMFKIAPHHFLNSSWPYFLMTPNQHGPEGTGSPAYNRANVFEVTTVGSISYSGSVDSYIGHRHVINLKQGVQVESGDGSAENPFIIK